jgi:hypothetical protein
MANITWLTQKIQFLYLDVDLVKISWSDKYQQPKEEQVH